MNVGTSALAEELAKLADSGLNWVAFVEATRGGLLPGRPSSPGYGLLLLLSLGRTFGDQTEFAKTPSNHPFDERACSIGDAFVSRFFEASSDQLPRVYPGPESVNLRHWLEVGCVQFRSQIGIGIRPDCGTWMAVRLAYWVQLSAAQQEVLRGVYPPLGKRSPCDDCVERPCITHCPASAVTPCGEHLDRCIAHRLKPDSSCADRCLAREACPVGREHAYSDRQRAYHYSVSLRVLHRWSQGGGV